jgi:bisphosphoglycerate-independent phosphoglycerate mutase (AlkP superfamily)
MRVKRKVKSRNTSLHPHTKVSDWGVKKIIEKIVKAIDELYKRK